MRTLRSTETMSLWIAQVEQRLSRMERKPLAAMTTARAVVMVSEENGLPVGLEPGTEVQVLRVDPVTEAQTVVRYEQDAATGAWRTIP